MNHYDENWHVDPDPRVGGAWQVCREVERAGQFRSDTVCFIATGMDEDETASIANLVASSPALLAYAEMSEALGEYEREGSGFTQEMVMAVLTKYGYIPGNPEFPGIGAGRWARDFRKAAITKATQI